MMQTVIRWELESLGEPRLRFVPCPGVHADLAPAAALAAADEQGAAPLIEVGFGECEGFVEPETGSPENHDETAEPSAVRGVAGGAHDGDDLLNLGRVGGVAQALVAWRATRVKLSCRRGRPPPTSAVKQL
jgi:hypothetical protein